uniref:40S ribosomal protein S3 n=1 Tax=Cyprinus carpio TaxID=7962 RepID=A0A8C2FI84_CYPCA
MESGAKGCEVVVSGKLRGQRAKSMKFVDGLMIHSGDPVNYYVDTAVRHVLLRQGDEIKPTDGSLETAFVSDL